MVPFLGIVREGFIKELTVEVGLERAKRSSPDGEWGAKWKAHPDREDDMYQVAQVRTFRIYQ